MSRGTRASAAQELWKGRRATSWLLVPLLVIVGFLVGAGSAPESASAQAPGCSSSAYTTTRGNACIGGSLPASIENGSPAAGAGNLETSASEDVYKFETQAAGALQVDLSTCSSTLGSVNWKLVNADTGATVLSSSSTCSSRLVSSLAAGRYKLVVYKNGATGTYKVGLHS